MPVISPSVVLADYELGVPRDQLSYVGLDNLLEQLTGNQFTYSYWFIIKNVILEQPNRRDS